MNIATTAHKFDLFPFRAKFILTFVGIYVLIIGVYLSVLFFYSTNYIYFTIDTLLVFLSALFIVSCFYILKYVPDQSAHIPWKIFVFSVSGADILVLVQALLNNMLSSLGKILNLIIPLLMYLFGLYLITFAFQRKMIFFDTDANQLEYICDYGTRINKESIILSDVNKIEIKHKRGILIGPIGKIIFHINKLGGENEIDYSMNKTTREWNLTSTYQPYLFYALIGIFNKYPLVLVVDTKIPVHLLNTLLKKFISPTQIDFSENPTNYFSKLLQNISDSPKNDISNNNENSSSQKKNSLIKNQLVINPAHEIVGQNLFISNKFFVVYILILSLLLVYLAFELTNIVINVFIRQNLLGEFFESKASFYYSWYFNKFYFFNLYNSSLYFFVGILVLVVVLIFIAWIGLLSIFGKEYFIFTDDSILYTTKVFNKKLITVNIPKRSIIAIEHSNKGLVLQLLGGDSFVFKVSSSNEYSSKVTIVKSFLLSNK